jgi:5-methylcytosine-specific restriction endonuclease McrA
MYDVEYQARYRREHREELKSYCHARYLKQIEQRKIIDAEYRKNNKDKIRTYLAKYYSSHKQESKENHKKWLSLHPGKMKEYTRKYQSTHRAEVNARNAEYRKNHPEQIRNQTRSWRLRNPEKAIMSVHRRRARRLGAHGECSGSDIRLLKTILGTSCASCGACKCLSIDHVIPLAAGGSNHPTNIQFLCGSCNSSKNTRRKDYRTKKQIQQVMEEFQLKLF